MTTDNRHNMIFKHRIDRMDRMDRMVRLDRTDRLATVRRDETIFQSSFLFSKTTDRLPSVSSAISHFFLIKSSQQQTVSDSHFICVLYCQLQNGQTANSLKRSLPSTLHFWKSEFWSSHQMDKLSKPLRKACIGKPVYYLTEKKKENFWEGECTRTEAVMFVCAPSWLICSIVRF